METFIYFFEHFFAICGTHSFIHPTIFLVAFIAFTIYFGYTSFNDNTVTE